MRIFPPQATVIKPISLLLAKIATVPVKLTSINGFENDINFRFFSENLTDYSVTEFQAGTVR